jgi:light-regulated signal transduction histidine kinase (bacteriophytochrome)
MSEAQTTADLATCENEPIHTPGAIQPFGVLLALDPNTLTVQHASENNRNVFGLEAVSPLGMTVAERLGPATETALRYALVKDGLIDHRPIPISVPGSDASRWHGVAHSQSGMVFVELEPADEAATSPLPCSPPFGCRQDGWRLPPRSRTLVSRSLVKSGR